MGVRLIKSGFNRLVGQRRGCFRLTISFLEFGKTKQNLSIIKVCSFDVLKHLLSCLN